MALLTDMKYLEKIYKEAGRPGFPIVPYKIHWIPYRTKWDKDVSFIFPIYDPT